MNLTPESLAAALVGIPLLYGYVCRAAKVNWWDNRPLPVLFHLLGGVQVIWLMWLALTAGGLGFGWVGMGYAAAWLLWSYPTWRGGAPEHTLTRPAPLDVTGGRGRVWEDA